MKKEKTIAPKMKAKSSFWQKFLGIFAFIALFCCGVLVGLLYNKDMMGTNALGSSAMQCQRLAKKITKAEHDLTRQEELISLYNKNCFDGKTDAVSVVAADAVSIPATPLVPVDSVPALEPIAAPMPGDGPKRTCAVVESLLQKQLRYCGAEDSPDPDDHFNRAQIYTKLSEKGCPENAAKYKKSALREIAIIHALNDRKFQNKKETLEVIENYKRLNMKREAEQVFEKVKELTDPAIDFILQVEKIIED